MSEPTIQWKMGRGRVVELDGLRALSILLVITVHMHTHFWDYVAGSLGVDMFFVISGYLITGLALQEEQDKGSFSLGLFYIRRSLRLFPLYYLILGLYCLLILVMGIAPAKRPGLLHSLPYYLLYLQEIPVFKAGSQSFTTPFYQTWSLGIEEKFYLLWPVLCFNILAKQKGLRIVAASAMCLLCAVGGRWTLCYSYSLIGCLIALALQFPPFLKMASVTARWSIYPSALLVIVFPVLVTRVSWIPQTVLLFSCLCGWFLLNIVVSCDTVVHRVLRWRPLAQIGFVSYGIYLIHLLIIPLSERISGDRPVIAFFVAVVLSTTTAMVLYRVVEKPCVTYAKSLMPRD